MFVHKFLKEERERLGLTQAAMAELGHVKLRAYSYYESGERAPDTAFLVAIAAAGADVQYILTGVRSLDLLSREEHALLDNYRNSPPEGKTAIKAVGAAMAKSAQSEDVKPYHGDDRRQGE